MKSKSVGACLIVSFMLLFFFCGTHLTMAAGNKTKDVAAEKSEQITDTKNENLIAGKPEIFVELGHSSIVSSIAFSPDGRFALSGSCRSLRSG